MNQMWDMQVRSELFLHHQKLRTVSDGLSKLINGRHLTAFERNIFDYMGNLFGQIDWKSEHYEKNEHPELSVIATRLRPFFYEAVGDRFFQNSKYLEGIYKTLKSGGEEKVLSQEELYKTQQIFELMIKNISLQAQPHFNI
jgi:hypothetical protein